MCKTMTSTSVTNTLVLYLTPDVLSMNEFSSCCVLCDGHVILSVFTSEVSSEIILLRSRSFSLYCH